MGWGVFLFCLFLFCLFLFLVWSYFKVVGLGGGCVCSVCFCF